MRSRDERVDVTRGIGILLVVIGHNSILKGFVYLYEVIYVFHMPLFFFLSGFYLKTPVSISAVKSKFLHLIVPFFFVTAFSSLYYFLTGRPEPNFGYIGGALWATGHTIPWVPLWFLPTMFLGWLLASLGVAWVSDGKHVAWKYLAMAMVIVLLNDQLAFGRALLGADGRPVGLPWGIDLLPMVVFYIILGYVFFRRVADLVLPVPLIVALSVILVSLVFFGVSCGVSTDFNYRRFSSPLLGLFTAICGVCGAWFLGCVLSHGNVGKFLAYIGKNSMVVFIYHSAVQAFMIRALDAQPLSPILVGMAGVGLGVLIPLLFSVMVLKVAPKYSYIFGVGG